MNKLFGMLICVALFCFNLPIAKASENVITIYVSPHGTNSATGEIDKPIKEVLAAKSKVSQIIADGTKANIEVVFREGEYYFDKSLNFTSADSPKEPYTVTYKAYKDEKVSFSGAKTLNTNDFGAITDKAVIKRLRDSAKDKIGQLDLKSQGINSIENFKLTRSFLSPNEIGFAGLYLDDQRQTIGQYPNDGFINLDKVLSNGYNAPLMATCEDLSPARWTTSKDAILYGYFGAAYAYTPFAFLSYDANKRIITGDRMNSNSYDATNGNKFRCVNLLEEVDIPGEYYLDTENLILYFMPPYSMENKKLQISLLSSDMITMKNAQNIRFENIKFEKMRKRAVLMEDSSNIGFYGCDFIHLETRAAYAIRTNKITFQSCNFDDIGSDALFITQSGDVKTLKSGENVIVNNKFSNLGIITRTCTFALYITDTVGAKIENNIIHNIPNQAIRFQGNDMTIKYNEIYNLLYECLDTGAVYGGRSFVQRGNEIAYNYIHDITAVNENEGISTSGIYLDDLMSGESVHHNIIKNVALGILVGGGSDNLIYNNTIVDCGRSMEFDARGLGWGRNMGVTTCFDEAKRFNYNQAPYVTRYPLLANLNEENAGYPINNEVHDNFFVNCKEPNIAQEVKKSSPKIFNNIQVEKTDDFVNPQIQDYSVKKDSQTATKIPGIADSQIDKIGLYEDEYREKPQIQELQVKKISPKNGSSDIKNNKIVFNWDYADDVDFFILTIATDVEMKDVVFTHKTMKRTMTVTDLKSKQTKYYWNVSAQNTSKQMWKTEISKSNPYLFSTTQYDFVDRTQLQNSIEQAQIFSKNIIEGTNVGEFKIGTQKEVLSAIKKSNNIFSKNQISQKENDSTIIELEKAINKAKANQKFGYVNLSSYLAEEKDWKSDKAFTVKDNSIVPVPSGIVSYVKKPMEGCEALVMKLKVNYGKGWGGFALRQSIPGKVAWTAGNDAYMVIIKPDIIELQRFSNGQSKFLKTVENTYIKNNEECEVQLGSFNTEEGVKIQFCVNGDAIFNVLDEENYISQKGYFSIYDSTSNGSVCVSGVDELPKEEFTIDKKTVFVEPVYADMKKLFSNNENWLLKAGHRCSENGLIIPKDVLITKTELPQNNIYKFKGTFNFAGGWQGITLRQLDPNKSPWLTNCYLIALKDNVIEIQKFYNGVNTFIGILDNTYIKSGKEADFEVAAYDTEAGTRILLKINGSTVCDTIDESPLTTQGSLGFYNMSGNGITIK